MDTHLGHRLYMLIPMMMCAALVWRVGACEGFQRDAARRDPQVPGARAEDGGQP